MIAGGIPDKPIKVPQPKFQEIESTYSADRISYNQPIRGTFFWDLEQYVCIQGCSDYANTFPPWVVAVPIYIAARWKELNGREPKEYPGYVAELRENDMGYDGMIVQYKGQSYVLGGQEICFQEIEEGSQLSIF